MLGIKKPRKIPRLYIAVPDIVAILRSCFGNQLVVTLAGELYSRG